jgi:hypothetical protein
MISKKFLTVSLLNSFAALRRKLMSANARPKFSEQWVLDHSATSSAAADKSILADR